MKPSSTPDSAKMGTPENGFCKPYRPTKPYPGKSDPMTVRAAVARYGDDWRLFIDKKSPFSRGHLESTTHDCLEAIHMGFMERGIKARVEICE